MPTTEPIAALPLGARLKAETQPHHDAAEGHPFQQALVQGRLPREKYIRYLQELALVHATLDAHLESLSDTDSRAGAFLSEQQHQSRHLSEDLAFFGAPQRPENPTQAAQSLAQRINTAWASCPASILGFHYVTLGSTNGGRFIARAVRRAYDLSADGTRYLDPYGEGQRPLWLGFKAGLDEARFSEDEAARIIEAAKAMFDGIAAIAGEIEAETA